MSCENCKYLIIQNGYEPKCIKGGIPFYNGDCPLFEYDKNVDNYKTAKPKKEIPKKLEAKEIKIYEYKGYTFKEIINLIEEHERYKIIKEDINLDLIKILTAKEVYTFDTSIIAPHKLGRTNKIIKCNNFYFDFIYKTIHIHVPKVGLYCEPFSNYGKDWAFTKQELEKINNARSQISKQPNDRLR